MAIQASIDQNLDEEQAFMYVLSRVQEFIYFVNEGIGNIVYGSLEAEELIVSRKHLNILFALLAATK